MIIMIHIYIHIIYLSIYLFISPTCHHFPMAEAQLGIYGIPPHLLAGRRTTSKRSPMGEATP
jgi:hypothetical protein